MRGKSEHEVGGQTEHEGVQDEGVGGQTEQVTRSVDPQKPVQFAHPTTPDYQPLTNQPLTVGVDFSEKRESEKIARPNRVKHTAHGEVDREKQAAHQPLKQPPTDLTPKNNHPKKKKESAMRVGVTRQAGKPGFFHMGRDTKSDDGMFI